MSKKIGNIKKYHDGGKKVFGIVMPYTHNWSLEAYDISNNLIVKVNTNETNNYIKYVKFIYEVRNNGYELTRKQINYLREPPFFIYDLIEMIKLEHIVEVGEIFGYSKDFILGLKTKSQEEKDKFTIDIGLFPDELQKVIDVLNL